MGLPRWSRLGGSARIRQVAATGRRRASACGVVHVLRRPIGEEPACRLALAYGRRLGSAVRRNRSRRQVQAAFCRLEPNLHPGYDILFRARPGILELSGDAAEAALADLFWGVGLLAEKPCGAPGASR